MSSNMWLLHAFSQINFIFQGNQDNQSKTLNNLRNIFPAAAFEKPIIRHKNDYKWIHILFCKKLQYRKVYLLIGTLRQNTCRFGNLY